MGTDDTDDKPRGEAGRETFETVPPELRPYYVPGPSEKIDLTKNPRLAAIRAGLEMLDRMEEVERRVADAERREAAANGSTKAHIASVAIPQPARPRADPPAARVEISAPGQEHNPPAEGKVIQFGRTRLAERKAEQAEAKPSTEETATPKDDEPTLQKEKQVEAKPAGSTEETATPKDDEPTLQKKDKPAASPWTKQAADDVRASALPSSLRPRDLAADGDTPASVKPAGVPAGGHGKTAVAVGIAILVVAVVIGVRALSAGRTPESVATTPVATVAATTTAAATPMASAAASVDAATPPAASGTNSAEPAPTPSSAPAPTSTPKPKRHGALDDPYGDASAPSPVVTAQPQVATATPTVASTAPPAPTTPGPKPLQPQIKF